MPFSMTTNWSGCSPATCVSLVCNGHVERYQIGAGSESHISRPAWAGRRLFRSSGGARENREKEENFGNQSMDRLHVWPSQVEGSVQGSFPASSVAGASVQRVLCRPVCSEQRSAAPGSKALLIAADELLPRERVVRASEVFEHVGRGDAAQPPARFQVCPDRQALHEAGAERVAHPGGIHDLVWSDSAHLEAFG